MANWWVDYAGGSNANAGTAYTSPKKTLWAADASGTALFSEATPPAAGDTVYVLGNAATPTVETHTTATALTCTTNGTDQAPVRIIVVDSFASGSPGPSNIIARGHKVQTTGSGASLTTQNCMVVSGLIFEAGTGTNNTNNFNIHNTGFDHYLIMQKGQLSFNTTGSSSIFRMLLSTTGYAQRIELDDVTVKFAVTNKPILPARTLLWKNTPSLIDTAGSIPANLFQAGDGSNAVAAHVELRNNDFTGLGTNPVYENGRNAHRVNIIGCKIAANNPIVGSAVKYSGGLVLFARDVDSGNTTYRFLEDCHEYTAQSDTAVYRNSGSTIDSTPISAKLTTGATGPHFYKPGRFRLPAGKINAATAKTITVFIAQNNAAAALNDDEIWIEVEYQDDTTTQQIMESDRKATWLTSAAAQTTDSVSTWTGLTSPTKQKLEVTTTQTGKAGQCYVWVCIAKPSTTVYVDLVPVVT